MLAAILKSALSGHWLEKRCINAVHLHFTRKYKYSAEEWLQDTEQCFPCWGGGELKRRNAAFEDVEGRGNTPECDLFT